MHPAAPVAVSRPAALDRGACRSHACLALAFAERNGATKLVARRHQGQLVVQKPLYPEGGAVCHAIVVHPPGGIAAGDVLELSAQIGAGAHALLTTPGATKWYRSEGAWARQQVTLDAGPGAIVEWLPQETIVFRSARADSRVTIALTGDARAISWEILCLGRTGSGERFDDGCWRGRTQVTIAGRPVWHERAILEAGTRPLESPAGLAGASVVGTLTGVGPRVDDTALAALRAVTPTAGEGAVTRLPHAIIARFRGHASAAAREYFAQLWTILRPTLTGRAAVVPRIWNT